MFRQQIQQNPFPVVDIRLKSTVLYLKQPLQYTTMYIYIYICMYIYDIYLYYSVQECNSAVELSLHRYLPLQGHPYEPLLG